MHRLATLAATFLLAGCATDPCEADVLGCKEGEPLLVDASCETDEELTLQLRDGETDTPLSSGVCPVMHHGPQGGVHFMLALGIFGMDPAHDQVEVTVRLEACDDDACEAPTTVTERRLVVDGEVLVPEDDGGSSLRDVLMLLDHEPPENGRVVVRAHDACDRTAELVHPCGG